MELRKLPSTRRGGTTEWADYSQVQAVTGKKRLLCITCGGEEWSGRSDTQTTGATEQSSQVATEHSEAQADNPVASKG